VKTDVDVVVVGVGAMGAMSLWRLAARGASVVGIERFSPGHDRGSSHGGSRIFRTILFEGSDYVPLARRARQLWHHLEQISGVTLFTRTGGLTIGPATGSLICDALTSAAVEEVEHEMLDTEALRRRFPQHAAFDDDVAMLEPAAGVLRPEAAILAAVKAATDAGATVLAQCRALQVETRQSGVVVDVDGHRISGRRLVLATGAWFGELLPGLHLPIRIQRSALAWFRGPDEGVYRPSCFPVFVRESGPFDGWGIPDIDGTGVKVGLGPAARVGSDVKRWLEDPDANPREVKPEELRPFIEFCQAALRGLSPTPVRAQPCLNAKTPDGHFIIGLHPAVPNVVLVGGFSGHGFKHATAVGDVAAELALEGGTNLPLGRFSPTRFEPSASG
jgi:sarcosine oxidase